MLFKNYAFIYYLTAALFTEQKPIEWCVSTVVMVFGGMKLFLPKAPVAEASLEKENNGVSDTAQHQCGPNLQLL